MSTELIKIPSKISHSFNDYARFITAEQVHELQVLAKDLAGKKILEINSTAKGGGVAELLHSQIPLAQSLNIVTEWYTIPPDKHFFDITKELHNRLQGQASHHEKLNLAYYQQYLAKLAQSMPPADIYVLHDPQALGLAPYLKATKILWRCHIDLTNAQTDTLDWLMTYYNFIDRLIFTTPEFAQAADPTKTSIIQPAIDPLSDKNRELSKQEIASLLTGLQVDPDQPYILQVSRFDKFKDPQGVLDIYSHMHKTMPELRCILAGDFATDDPEGEHYYIQTKQYAERLKLYGVQFIVGETGAQINALQTGAVAVIQNSHREGFGLTVTEAMWKKKVVFTRPVGGITMQVTDQQTGFFLKNNAPESAAMITDILKNPGQMQTIGEAARRHVQLNYTTPLMLLKYLKVYI